MSGLLLTAGYDRAWHSLYVAERLRRVGRPPALILLAYPLSAARIRTIVRSRGLASIAGYLAGRDRVTAESPMRAALRQLGIAGRPSLKAWAREHRIPLVTVGDLNGARAVHAARELAPQVTAYTGGGILRRAFLQAAGPVLNAHSGPLPAVRGMNALEWSLLLDQRVGVTMHIIDEGIDTGATLQWIDVAAEPADTLDALRERLVLAGAQGMVCWVVQTLQGGLRPAGPDAARALQRQCFVVAPALRELAQLRLARLHGTTGPVR